jgi:hypothetical protein
MSETKKPLHSGRVNNNRDYIMSVSSYESRRRGGLHYQHLRGVNHKYTNDCLLCNPPKELTPATPAKDVQRTHEIIKVCAGIAVDKEPVNVTGRSKS